MAMTKHAARQTFVAICVVATLLSSALPVHGEEKPPAKPPRWMPEVLAEAVQRLSPKVDTFAVNSVVCDAAAELPKLPEPGGGQQNGAGPRTAEDFCGLALEPLSLFVGKERQVLKGVTVESSLQARVRDTGPVANLDELDHIDAAYVYVFKITDADPARVLWDKLRADSETRVQRVADIEVIRRKVPRQKGSDYFYYWSPRKGVAVVVLREKLLEDTVRLWSAADPGPGPFPWDLPEWRTIGANAVSWGMISTPQRGKSAISSEPKRKERPTTSPKWMPELTAEAVQRLSPKVDRFIVCQGERTAMPKLTKDKSAKEAVDQEPPLEDLAKNLAGFYGDQLYEGTLEQLNLLLGKDRAVLKPFQILCALQALSRYKPVRQDAENHYDAACVYVFKVTDVDPARVLWDKMRSDKSTEVKRVGEVEVLVRNMALDNKGRENFYYWSPRAGVAVVVRREALLEDMVLRWSTRDPGPGPFPWDLPEWDSIAAGASTWGISRADLDRVGADDGNAEAVEEKPAPSFVISMDPKNDPKIIYLTTYFPREFAADQFLTKSVGCATVNPLDEENSGAQLFGLSMFLSLGFFPGEIPRFGP